MPDGEIVRLETPQRERAGRLLARAFQDDPMYRHVIPDEVRRAQTLSWLFDRVVIYSLLYGDVYTTSAVEGIACWLPPGETEITLGRVVRSGLAATPLKLGWAAYRRFDRYVSSAERHHARHAPQIHWYLFALAVDPVCQGKGIGSRLLEPVLAKVTEDGIACYLETEVERNLRFYERHGFKTAAEWEIPGSGVQVWAMLREPTTA